MVAFKKASDALTFALDVQQQLHAADWPEHLLALPPAAPSSDALFRGLRVRIGIHTGDPLCEEDGASGHSRPCS